MPSSLPKAKYQFRTEQFGLNDEGIHLLRTGFPYLSMPWRDITKVKIRQGREYSRWRIMLGLGILLLSFSIVYGIAIYRFLNSGTSGWLELEYIAAIGMPLAIGGFLVAGAMQRSPVMELKHAGKLYHLSLRAFAKEGQLHDFVQEVKSLGAPLSVEAALDVEQD